MLRRRNQQNSDQNRRKRSTCLSLLTRIYNQRRLDIWNRFMRDIQGRSLCLLIYLVILIIFQCPNRMYNGWNGPFPMNINQFRSRLEINSNLLDLKSYFPFDWSLFYPEYIQIELGENAIDQSTKNTLRVFYGHYSNGNLLYTFNPVQEPDTNAQMMSLYVKFVSQNQSYSEVRYSYHFKSFSIKTLQCILQQFNISSKEFLHWPEKSIYIEKIEQIYDKDPILFNKKVIKKCGILIGYLYRPRNEFVFPANSYEYHKFSKNVRIFDASSFYTPYISYILVGLFVYLLFVFVVHTVQEMISLIKPSFSIVHPSIEEHIRTLNLNSLENLDNILLNTTDENNHYDRLFIVHEKYLVMLMIDLNENSTKILQRFYENAPLMIISIDMISKIKSGCIQLKTNNSNRRIEFPTRSSNTNLNPSTWLHQRLMILNDQYRYNWEEEERLRHLEESRRAEEEEHRRLLSLLIEEETQYQQDRDRNDPNRIFQRITSASPSFIAQFRLDDRQMVTEDLLGETCTICLDDFRSNSYIGRWPCTAQHMFHFDCMLDVLRAGNTCPLCRFPVEAAPLPSIETAFRLLFASITPNIFNRSQ